MHRLFIAILCLASFYAAQTTRQHHIATTR